jgi:predicted lipoprotein with Yx(FWY)xxD motif
MALIDKGIVIALLAATLGAALAGCGSMTPSSQAPAVTSAPVAASKPVTRLTATRETQPLSAVRVASTDYGRALVDRRGYALYRFTSDRSTASTCYGACAGAWPPYLVAKRPSAAGRGAVARLLGIVPRRDGRLQVTYAGHPLYYYLGDRRPGEVLCQAVTEYGGTWYVVAPDGHAIR